MQQLEDILMDYFSDRRSLEQFARFSLGINLQAITVSDIFRETVFDLVTWANHERRLEDLVGKVVMLNPGHHVMQRFCQEIREEKPALDRRVSDLGQKAEQGKARHLRVFLYDASSGKLVVRDLYHQLRGEGVEPWLDEEDLLPGQDRTKEIPKAVRAADIFAICLSSASVTEAEYAQEEIARSHSALSSGTPCPLHRRPDDAGNCAAVAAWVADRNAAAVVVD